jgi:protein-S-isoprenylcysteine O-methyltransferase Ste14
MSIYTIFLIVVPGIWIIFEVGLVVRDAARGKGTTTDDKGSRNFNFFAITIGLVVSALLGEIPQFVFPGGKTNAVFLVGMGVVLAGMALRYWAIFTLGASFRTTIETEAGQKVVSAGPYRLIRHPSYAGWLLICLGYGIVVQSWLSVLVAVLPALLAFLYRIHHEEQVLVSSIGADYVEYQKHTKRLIPWVW